MNKMKRIARTKIIATLGPSSDSLATLRNMVLAGLDVARLNFSHGTHEEHLHRIETIKKINQKYRRHIRVLQDLEGYRIRVGRFKGGHEKVLEKGSVVWMVPGSCGGDRRVIPFDYKGNPARIKKGQLVYIDDGNIILKVKSSSKINVKLEVIEGGRLKERKGINMPGLVIPFSGVTPKDKEDIKFGIRYKVDYVAQSFVRAKKDVIMIRELLEDKSPGTRVIAKIEAREALTNIDEIIDASDGIMVARGDMGIAVPIYEIPVIQKMIIKKCNKKKKFVITATEMLEHMTEHSRPTRAEVTDVANAILDGTDFVMLSAETAAGKYPVRAVKMMDLIIKYTENWQGKGR